MEIPPGRRSRLHRARRLGAALLPTALVAAAVAGPASAATVAQTNGATTYWAGLNETNVLRVTELGTGGISFRDAGAAIAPGHGCAAESDGSVTCRPNWDRLTIFLRDGSDVLETETETESVHVFAGAGADDVRTGSNRGGEMGPGVDTIAIG